MKAWLTVVASLMGVHYGMGQAINQEGTKVPTSGLVAFYPFNGNANDESGKGYAGKVNGATLTQDRFGTEKHAYAFNGIDNEIVIQPPPGLTPKGLTVSLWVRFDFRENGPEWMDIGDGAARFHSPILGQDDGYAVRCFQLWMAKRNIVWHRMNEHSSVWTKWDVETARWYHVAATFDGKDHVLYINGKKEWGAPGILKVSSEEPIRIGSKGDELVKKRIFFAGVVDDVRFYNRALAETEVQTLFVEKPGQTKWDR
jgi:hypothetical protein